MNFQIYMMVFVYSIKRKIGFYFITILFIITNTTSCSKNSDISDEQITDTIENPSINTQVNIRFVAPDGSTPFAWRRCVDGYFDSEGLYFLNCEEEPDFNLNESWIRIKINNVDIGSYSLKEYPRGEIKNSNYGGVYSTATSNWHTQNYDIDPKGTLIITKVDRELNIISGEFDIDAWVFDNNLNRNINWHLIGSFIDLAYAE